MKQIPGALAKALYNNTPDAPNELMFRKGDILTVLEYDYDGQPGWWFCALRGERGICPSNYLILLEDTYYSILDHNRAQMHRSLSNSGEAHESAWRGTCGNSGNSIDPIETYDVPRSNRRSLSKSTSQLSHSSLYANESIYENEQRALSPADNKTNPLDLYDVPRSHLPIYGQSLSRLRRYGPGSERSLNSSNPQRHSDTSNGSSVCSSSSCDSALPPAGNNRGTSNRASPVNLSSSRTSTKEPGFRNNYPIHQTEGTRVSVSSTTTTINHSNRSSIQSESAESGIVMVSSIPNQTQDQSDLYDVPRSAVLSEGRTEVAGKINSAISRPQSALSVSSSGVGLSIANSDSKDSLDLYDVPRNNARIYKDQQDQLQGVNGHGMSNSNISGNSTLTNNSIGHSRTNSTSSIFSAYGYSSQNAEAKSNLPRNSPDHDRSSLASSSSSSFIGHSANDLYDVPRNHNTTNSANQRFSRPVFSRSQASLPEENGISTYDIPASFTKKMSLRDSSETLSCKDTGSDDGESRNGIRISAVSTSSLKTNESRRSSIGTGATTGPADLKILPLGTKAAVSVCEKLRHEVVTSISCILDHVKPKWRTKENLTNIMPDFRFSCTRLSLAIKDVAEFATRTLSNAKQAGDDVLLRKLHRLMIPVMNGSQIIQRDVDELEAYFWSAERLSVSSSSSHDQDRTSGDALDQLILCSRSLKHDVTEIANFIALNSSILFREQVVTMELTTARDDQTNNDEPEAEDYDYVDLTSDPESHSTPGPSKSGQPENPTSSLHLDSKDEHLVEYYSAQVAVTAPLLSQSISTFVSSIHQNEPPERFNIHLKYVILLAYRLLFAGDTVHRNLGNIYLKTDIERKSNDLHKSILALYEASKVATMEFPKIGPIQNIVDKVWAMTRSATDLKKIIFNAACTSST